MTNPTPLEARKLELRSLIEARAKATQGEWSGDGSGLGHCVDNELYVFDDFFDYVNTEFTSHDMHFIALAANQAARIVEDLLLALDALEKTKAILISEFGPSGYEVNFVTLEDTLTKLTRSQNEEE